MRCGAPVLAALLALGLGQAARAATAEALAGAEARLAAAGDALSAAQASPDGAADGAADGTAALASAIGDYEAALAGLREVVLGASGRERELALALATRREAIIRQAATLQAMGRVPPSPPGLHPAGPLGAARANMVLAHAAPAMKAESAELAEMLEEMEVARGLQRAGLSELASGLTALEAARGDLAQDMQVPAPGALTDPSVAASVRESGTLTELAAALAAAGAGASTGASPGEGGLLWPAPGRVVVGYNQPDGSGARRPGILVAAPALSLVAAPAAGVVRYAGPFLEFGYVVVLDIGGDATVVLAGLAQLNVATGASVSRGELLGLLGGRNLAVEEYVMLPHAETGAGALETLYIEIRHGRGPVDPNPWFGDGNGWEHDE